ncbi:MAG: hypothetical protein CMG11_04015 [Candidatus Marinimicrobia bacterium]|nr:hypothetical protein [Candidatus Neomarinimicrobiota bacterium]
MIKMKSYKTVLLIILFIYNCDEQSNIITNPISENNLIYNANYADFKSLNSGMEKYSVNLNWESYLGQDFISYEISDQDDNIIQTLTDQNLTTYSMDMELNDFKDVNFILTTDSESQNISTIRVFTKPVYGITNFTVTEYSNYNQLSWTQSEDDDINQLIIYRAELDPGSDLPLINEINGKPNPSIWSNLVELTSNISTYTDNNVLIEPDYYYIVESIDGNDGHIYSFMSSNISGAIDSGIIFGLNNNYTISLTSSESLNGEIFSNKTAFSWNQYAYDDFYEFEIWKSEEENFIIDGPESSLIATITDQSIANFEDYNDVGNNKTWYYKIRLYNIYGNYIDSETIECNTSL